MSPVLSCAILLCYFGQTGSINVALNKNASQSSNYFEDKWLAPTGVDGLIGDNKMNSSVCFHTGNESQAWWMVDLLDLFSLSSVVIHNRFELDPATARRARDISIEVGQTLNSMRQKAYLMGGHEIREYPLKLFGPVVGRYVRLQMVGPADPLHLCEVQVISYHSAVTNVALNKNASMSSNFSAVDWDAPNGVDGNIGGQGMASKGCFHTIKETNPWWRVDLGRDYEIVSVKLYNRLDCCAFRARNIGLTTGTSLNSMVQRGFVIGKLGANHEFTIDPAVTARFVQIQMVDIVEYLHLCEVMVYGVESV